MGRGHKGKELTMIRKGEPSKLLRAGCAALLVCGLSLPPTALRAFGEEGSEDAPPPIDSFRLPR